MKASSHSDSEHSYNDKKFTLSIGAIYFALLAMLLMFSPEYARTDLNFAVLEKQQSDQVARLAAVGRGEHTWVKYSVYEASLWTKMESL